MAKPRPGGAGSDPDAQPDAVSGWGRAGFARSVVVNTSAAHAPAALQSAGERGAIGRGLGRSYGDAAQNSGGEVIRLHPDAMTDVDPPIALIQHDDHPAVSAHASVSIADLITYLVPHGYFVPVTPGTRNVTVGGAIASDVHGKNHHADGSFGNHVSSIRLLRADQTVVDVTPENDAELFWATIGGMGLTGLILSATFDVIGVETSRMAVSEHRIDNLGEIMSEMVAGEPEYRYTVAWLDLANARRRGIRGILINANHARLDQLSSQQRRDPFEYHPGRRVSVPGLASQIGFIRPPSVRAFSQFWYRRAPRRASTQIASIPAYFHPLDQVQHWNRLYGSAGFLQYQFVVPMERQDVLVDVLNTMGSVGLPTFLTVLKRFGPGNQGHLSFPLEGWSLAVDVSTRFGGLASLLRSFDDQVLDAGGRHFLAKDFLMGAGDVRRGYHRLPEWQAIQRRVDPHGRWTSDLNRRLHLTGVLSPTA